MFDFIMPKLNLLNELQFLLQNLAATPIPLLCPFSLSFFPVQCMMFKATYSPAEANNKRKETKWAGIFSMQNVCGDGWTKRAGFLTHRASECFWGPGWGSPEMPEGTRLQPQAWSIPSKLELEGGGWLPVRGLLRSDCRPAPPPLLLFRCLDVFFP